MKVSWIGTDLVFSVQEHRLSTRAIDEVNDKGGREKIRDAAKDMDLQPGLQGELPPESTLRKTLELAAERDMGISTHSASTSSSCGRLASWTSDRPALGAP